MMYTDGWPVTEEDLHHVIGLAQSDRASPYISQYRAHAAVATYVYSRRRRNDTIEFADLAGGFGRAIRAPQLTAGRGEIVYSAHPSFNPVIT